MIIDVFPYYNEIEILSARIETLRDVVDAHVIVEGDLTHQGEEKPLYLDGQMLPGTDAQIIRVVAELPRGGPQNDWTRERLQRERGRQYLDTMNLDGDDLIITTDADEIPNPAKIEQILAATTSGPCCLRMPILWRGTTHYVSDTWIHPKAFRWKDVTLTLTDLRLAAYYPQVLNAGWHITYWGDERRVRDKLESFAHREYNMEVTKQHVAAGGTLGGEPLQPYPQDWLPEPIRRWLS